MEIWNGMTVAQLEDKSYQYWSMEFKGYHMDIVSQMVSIVKDFRQYLGLMVLQLHMAFEPSECQD
jgi:hypothetical protein